MERLTKVMICPDKTKIYDISNKLCGLDTSRAAKTRMILEKLAAYEDAEEQGLLLRLPCGVGTTIYKVENNATACGECNDFESGYGYRCDDYCDNKNVHDEDGCYISNPQYADKPLCQKHFFEVNEYTMNSVDEIFRWRDSFGKTVFLAREEAEAKLEELRGNQNGKV